MINDELFNFIRVVESGTIAEAAKWNGVSTSTVRRAIEHLESSYGCTLFDRVNNRLVLNEKGKIVYTYAKQIENSAIKAREEIEHYLGDNEPVHLSSTSLESLLVLRSLFNLYRPYLTVKCYLGDERDDQVVNNLSYGAYLGHESFDNPHYVSIRLYDEQLYIAVKENDALSQKSSVSFKDINGIDCQKPVLKEWADICKDKMPDTTFISRDDPQYDESLPFFCTDLQIGHIYENRQFIPVIDECATLPVYLVYGKDRAATFSFIKHGSKYIEWDLYAVEPRVLGEMKTIQGWF